MQTRACVVHMSDHSIVKLHYRTSYLHYHWHPYAQLPTDYDVEFAKTTLGVQIARVVLPGKKPSPWFEVTDSDLLDEPAEFIEWWTSGMAISDLMMR